MERELIIYTAYNNPSDYPGYIVVRGWTIRDGQERPHQVPFMLAKDIEDVRKAMREIGKVILTRYTADDPVIIESYI